MSATPNLNAALAGALRIIGTTPGYEDVARDLTELYGSDRIRFDAALEDRAHAGLLGAITLGPEATESGPLSLAQTLVHEHFHLRQQNPLQKTASFWQGVASRTEPMQRYERPAYRAAFDFLEAAKSAHPTLADEAAYEQDAIRQVFESSFGGTLEE